MEYKEALDIIGGLSKPSKMPWRSWSIPAQACKTGSLLRKKNGSVCGKCYAMKGMYSFPNVKAALNRRLKAIDHPLFVEAFSLVLNKLVGKSRKKENRFRWHDSGDLQGLWHLEKIATVAKLTPECMHWLPTREYSMVKAYIAKHGALPGNLIIRLSAMYVDKQVTIPASLQNQANVTVSNVHTINPMGLECQAPKNKGQCGPCRACWGTEPVSYKAH